MTIIVFLIDTSASMNQRTYLGARPTLLDVAKDSVEKFLKIRQRDVASRQDRYMLLTFDEYPSNIKAGWKENHNVFINELKNLTASGMTLLGPAIKNCFDLLNLNRMQTGIDTYGQGRSPFFLESSIIIAITDGGKLTNGVTVQEELNLPMNCNVPGAELTKEPFRWDQRLYALVLRLTGTPPTEHLSNGPPGLVSSDSSPIDAMCEVTGGRSYSISSQRSLMQCLESVVQKIQSGVVIHFEKVGPDPPAAGSGEEESEETNQEMPKIIGQNVPNGFISNHKGNIANQAGVIISSISNSSNNSNTSKPPWHSVRKLIYVHRSAQRGYSTGFWPIPESFWPDLNTPSLPPRTCHPIVKFTCAPSDPMVIDNLPFDKYELETSPLTQFILSRKQPHVAWQCFVSNSHKSIDHPLGYPFGYLKASTNLNCVNLFVLPYNYPVILPLLDELFKVHHCKPTREWKAQFDAYLKNIPLYYAGPLKRALQKMGGPNLVPDNMENCLSYSVLNLLKRLKNQAKVEFEKLVATVGTGKPATPTTIKVPNMSSKKISDIVNMNDPCLKSRFSGLRNEINDFQGFSIRIRDKAREAKPQCYRNPYDITRHQIIDQIHRMRNNFLQPPRLIRFHDEDQIHNLPVSQMGNYQEYLKRIPTPLRELESAPVRQHMFGNPFKIDKGRALGMIDEADIDLVGGNSPVKSPKRPAVDSVKPFSPRHLKRRPGPLPKELAVQYMSSQKSSRSLSSPPSSPLPTPPSSPSSSSEASFSSASSSPASSPCPSPSLSSPITLIPPNLSGSNPTSTLNNTTSNHNQFILHDTNTDSSESLDIDIVNSVDDDDDDDGDVEIIKVPDPEMTILAPPSSGQEVTSEPSHRRKNITSFNENNTNNDNTNSLITESTNSGVHNSSYSANTSICNGISNSIGDHSMTNLRWTLSSEELELKRELFRLVRKPGRNFQPIFNQLSNCHGPLRDYLIKEIVSEATRFKRKSLIEMIERFGSEPSLSTNSSRLG